MNFRLRKSIQQILLAGSTAIFAAGTLAAVGQQNPPPGPGQIPDYFGVVPNYATSPQPVLATVTITDPTGTGQGAIAVATTYDYVNDVQTDKIMDVQVLNPGTGYDPSTTVTINGGPNVTTQAQVVPNITNGVITGFTINNAGAGFKTPIANSGIRKFVDTLPLLDTPNNLGQQMPKAVADTATFANSDYYEIAEVEYTQKLHSDLPPTHLRGYVQIKNGGFTIAGFNAAADKLAYASQYAGYLGPVIVAQKDRPVRIKLVNLLSTGKAGELPIPVDHTYMGADGATDTDNRTALHLHGGNTPWISDGTPRQWVKPKGEVGPNKGESARSVPDMWFDASGALIADPNCQGKTTCTVPGATNDPGDGALTFFYTNEQSARLMFYHDHAEGTTRLNVYAGMAAGYILQDATEQALVTDGTLPPLADTIPLVIQEKTFVPNNTVPVLNFYGPFRSALNSQDPTWRWGTTGYDANGAISTGLNGNGDLWVPHVFMPNQNPGDVSGANSVGRWDYGAWFWPPFVNLQNGPIDNPYYDPNCNTTTTYCEGKQIPGVPNGSLLSVKSGDAQIAGGVFDKSTGKITESPSGTPEAFNDTPLVNGTAYPYIEVDPKQYRLRILSVGNDRMLNLSMLVAASKNSVDTTAQGNAGTTNNTILCDGSTAVNPADCTEVKMVPFDAAQDKAKPFPGHWYSKQKGGVTFDGRPSGVFDPATRGPEMVQIGTEGGFLAAPVEIPNQPVNYEYNPKNILIGNIKEHALLLGPAERADVLVDFSNFAGSTLILYNDAGAPVPAWDLRLDYYTGNFDNTDTGGAFSVIPGYGPNSRTLMQIRVSGSGGTHPVDDKGNINLATLTAKVQNAFKTSQEPIIVPQSVYNGVYGINATDALGQDLSRIGDTWLTYTPLDPLTRQLSTNPAVKLEMEPKTIIEDWTMNWGRMNALLGTEVPRTTATIQTSIPQAFIDPPTDLVKITPNDNMIPISGTLPDGTQLWKITHNGVDSHAIHFHLFHVQIVNRVGWDGAVYPPDANELGWKDTVRMNPLSDTVVALRPMTMTALPFKVPNSHHLIDPAQQAHTQPSTVNVPGVDVFNLSPLTGNASNVANEEVNYGWEYLWHCHILGHEENDMMRTIAVAQPPEAPVALTATKVASGVQLDWTDDSIVSNWVTIERSVDDFATIDKEFVVLFKDVYKSNVTGGVVANPVPKECQDQAGCVMQYVDTAPPNSSVYYRVKANNTVGAGRGRLDAQRNLDGSYGADLPAGLLSLTPDFSDYANVTGASDYSNKASISLLPNATVTPSLAFGNHLVNTLSTVQTVTVTNNGAADLVIESVALTSGATDYAIASNNCPATLAINTSCSIGLTFKPTSMGLLAGTLTITDNSGGTPGTTQTVDLTGTGIAPVAGLDLSTLTFAGQLIHTTSAAQMVILSNTGTDVLNIGTITLTGPFARTLGPAPSNCGTSLAAGSTCTISVAFTPSVVGLVSGEMLINDNSNGVATTHTVSLSGTGTMPIAGVSGALTFGDQFVNTSSLPQTVTLTNSGTTLLTISSIATNNAVFTATADGTNGSCGTTLNAGANCTIDITFKPTVTGAVSGNLTINDNSNGVNSSQSVSLSGTGTAPLVEVLPNSLSFAERLINTTSAVQPVTVKNIGTAPLSISGISAPAQFAQTSTCGAPLAVNATCTINVTFTPTVVGTVSDFLTINSNSNGAIGAVTVMLSGSGATVPAVPTGVSIQRIGTSFATLAWVDASNNETSFQMETSTNGGASWTALGTPIARTGAAIIGTGDVLTATNAVSNTTNAQYRIRAINGWGSVTSTPVILNNRVAPLAATIKTPLVANRINGNNTRDQVIINWTDAANNNASYRIQYSTTNGLIWTTLQSGGNNLTLPGDATSYTWNNAARNTTYRFRVVAVNSIGAVNSINTPSILTP